MNQVTKGTALVGALKIAGQDAVAGTQMTAITDAETEHALNSTFSDTEVEADLDALGGTVNEILAVLRAYGMIATS